MIEIRLDSSFLDWMRGLAPESRAKVEAALDLLNERGLEEMHPRPYEVEGGRGIMALQVDLPQGPPLRAFCVVADVGHDVVFFSGDETGEMRFA